MVHRALSPTWQMETNRIRKNGWRFLAEEPWQCWRIFVGSNWYAMVASKWSDRSYAKTRGMSANGDSSLRRSDLPKKRPFPFTKLSRARCAPCEPPNRVPWGRVSTYMRLISLHQLRRTEISAYVSSQSS